MSQDFGSGSKYGVVPEESRGSGGRSAFLRNWAYSARTTSLEDLLKHESSSPATITAAVAKRKRSWYRSCAHKIVSHKIVVGITSVLTVWILICDDLRILLTEKPADMAFEIALLVCIVVFALELILMCVGKSDYFLGFFFWLDLMAVATMIVDLPSIQEEVAHAEGTGEINETARGRTARIGSKAARVVRVVRIIRVLKLWRLFIETLDKQVHQHFDAYSGGHTESAEDDLDELPGDESAADPRKESRVGKKLSKMTVRRVILVILAMLFVVPLLAVKETAMHPEAAFYAADEIWDAFSHLGSVGEGEFGRRMYERMVLRLVYYQNWFTGTMGCEPGTSCPAVYYGRVFWIGIRGQDPEVVRSQAESAQIRHETVLEWERQVAMQERSRYNYGTMPAAALHALSAKWDINCSEDGLGISLLAVEVPGYLEYAVRCPSDLRRVQVANFFPQTMPNGEIQQGHFVFFFDMRSYTQAVAQNSLLTTGFLCVLLCVATMAFASDANRLVLYPLEDMIQKVEAIRAQPLRAVRMADTAFKAEERDRERREQEPSGWKKLIMCQVKKKKNQMMETRVLEKTIIKLGSLLALGFGQAGVNIIGQNMENNDIAGVDVMIAGQRVECIIGNARIPHFAVATEVLQSKIMSFVNQVAEIVHGIVDEFLGAVNKNTGDTFLLVWVLQDAENTLRQADMSIVAFSKIQGAIAVSSKLAVYRGHPVFQQRLGSEYRVELHTGLHAGWAIEGAVGSEFKIDASYISPNVSIADALAHASEAYGVSFLASEAVVTLCHQECQERCRVVDRVLVPGSQVPMELYCVDLDPRSLTVDADDVEKPRKWNPRQRFKARQFLEVEKKRKMNVSFQPSQLFHSDPLLVEMQKPYTEEFEQVFKMGYKNYLEGEWMCAKTFLYRTWSWGFKDGPSEALLHFMEQTHFVAPEEWPGFRDLDSVQSVFAGAAAPGATCAMIERGRSASTTKPKRTATCINGPGAMPRGVHRPSLSSCLEEWQTLPDKAFMDDDRASIRGASMQASPVVPPKGDTGNPEWQWGDRHPVSCLRGSRAAEARKRVKRSSRVSSRSSSRTRPKDEPVTPWAQTHVQVHTCSPSPAATPPSPPPVPSAGVTEFSVVEAAADIAARLSEVSRSAPGLDAAAAVLLREAQGLTSAAAAMLQRAQEQPLSRMTSTPTSPGRTSPVGTQRRPNWHPPYPSGSSPRAVSPALVAPTPPPPGPVPRAVLSPGPAHRACLASTPRVPTPGHCSPMSASPRPASPARILASPRPCVTSAGSPGRPSPVLVSRTPSPPLLPTVSAACSSGWRAAGCASLPVLQPTVSSRILPSPPTPSQPQPGAVLQQQQQQLQQQQQVPQLRGGLPLRQASESELQHLQAAPQRLQHASMLQGYLRPMATPHSGEEAMPDTPSSCTAPPEDRGFEPLTPDTTPRSKNPSSLLHGLAGSAIRVPPEPLSTASRATRDSQRSEVTVLPNRTGGVALQLHDKFFSFAANAEDQVTVPAAAVEPSSDCVDMARYLQEHQLPAGTASNNEPRPARPEKPPTISRDADRERKLPAREQTANAVEEEPFSNNCLSLQQKLLGIRCVAAGTGEAGTGVEDGCVAVVDDAAALAYKRRSFADTYHL